MRRDLFITQSFTDQPQHGKFAVGEVIAKDVLTDVEEDCTVDDASDDRW